MIKPSRKTLTWGTVTAAIVSACWLAADEGERLDAPNSMLSPASEHALPALPREPTAAGPAHPGSRALPDDHKRGNSH